MATFILSIVLVTGALLAVLAGWLISRRPLQRGCGKTPDQKAQSKSCKPDGCDLCKKDSHD